MAIISVGYDGPVNESQWAEMIKKIGSSEYGVVGAGDWKVTGVPATDRTVSVAVGKGWGHGVYDEITANITIQLDTVSSGSRWDLIVMKRDWTGIGGVSAIAKVNGTSTKEIPAARVKGPGVIDDQPLALVQVTAGQTAPTGYVDLRVWAGNGGLVALDDLAKTYMDAIGTQIKMGQTSQLWNRALGPDGNPYWTATAPDGHLPMVVGNTLAGGAPAPGVSFRIQAGTTVNVFDANGYARITFPQIFPNGLVYIAGFNGDDWSTGGSLTFASAGSNWGPDGYGTRSTWVYAGRSQEASVTGVGNQNIGRYAMAGHIHRINWLAIGW